MRHLTILFAVLVASRTVHGDDRHWNQFRGPGGDGISAAAKLPIEFDEAKNVRWKIAIPGQGWSSPVVWGNEIWLTTGSDRKKELRAICVDAQTGRVLKDIKVFDMLERQVVKAYRYDSPHLNSPATPTSVVEENRVFVHFGSQGIACLDRKTGKKIWERRDLRIYQPVRQGSSPIVDARRLFVAYDGTDQQFFVALNKATGKTVWKTDRNVVTDWNATLRKQGLAPKAGGGKPNDNKKSFATATLIEVDGKTQLIAPAAEATIAYDPENGKEIWRVLHPGGFNVSARPIYAHRMIYVFTSGLSGRLLAVKVDGQGDVTKTHIGWSTTRSTPRIPSPVILGDRLYMVTDRGVARCLNAKTGEEIWRKRLAGDHWASPVFAGDRFYFCSKQGNVSVLDASSKQEPIVSRNKLNASFIASPAVAGNSLILRSTTHLYCLADGYRRSPEEVAKDVYPKRVGPKATVAAASKKDRLAALQKKLIALVKLGTLTAEEAKDLYRAANGKQK